MSPKTTPIAPTTSSGKRDACPSVPACVAAFDIDLRSAPPKRARLYADAERSARGAGGGERRGTPCGPVRFKPAVGFRVDPLN
jgi:hypothetical protein